MSFTTANLKLPTKACHNCRRRRWKCDRGLPVCQKCLSAGSECLGYGKLFVWNEGVASRGKMMGKTYQERIAAKNGDGELSPFQEKQLPLRIQELPSHDVEPEPRTEPENVAESGLVDMSNEVVPYSQRVETVVHWALNDPLVQDLSPHARYYLYHFATQLCVDMVVYDEPGQNPMRDLIPATSAYPLLLQIILANSACHVFNISREPIDGASMYQEKQRPCLTAYYRAVTRFGGPLKTSYRDALIAKSSALSLLAKSIATVDHSNIDLILATIILFINYDLIESGKDKWKVHMEGARKLIHLLGTPAYQPHEMSKLRICLLSDFLVFYILGSTFSYTTIPKLIPDSIDIEPILQYAETNNYLSCPAPLLRIMLQSFDLPDTRNITSEQQEEVQEKVRILLEAAIAFDPVQWSLNFMPASPFEDLAKRVRIASAHRSAVCIYIARVLPCSNPLLDPNSGSALVSLTGLSDDIVYHVSHLDTTDTLFKSISWPLFLAGAEAEDPAQRTWIMNALDSFYGVMYWGYVPTVKKVLETIWLCKELASDGGANCWVGQVKDIGMEILVA